MANPTRSQPSSSRVQPSNPAQNQSQASNKPADYVYFDRSTTGFSDEAIPKAKGAQMKLEHYYKIVVDAAIERNTRSVHPRRSVWQ